MNKFVILLGLQLVCILNLTEARNVQLGQLGLSGAKVPVARKDGGIVGVIDNLASKADDIQKQLNANGNAQLNIDLAKGERVVDVSVSVGTEVNQTANDSAASPNSRAVLSVRTLRVRVPRDMSIGLDIKQHSLNFVIHAPMEEDPVVAKVHAAALA